MQTSQPKQTAKTSNSFFKKGSGVYTCICCGKATRATGRGDNEKAELCTKCFDDMEADNGLAD